MVKGLGKVTQDISTWLGREARAATCWHHGSASWPTECLGGRVVTLQLGVGFAGGLHTAQKDRGCHLHPSPTVNLGSQAEGCSSPDSLRSACSALAWEPGDAGAGGEGPYMN